MATALDTSPTNPPSASSGPHPHIPNPHLLVAMAKLEGRPLSPRPRQKTLSHPTHPAQHPPNMHSHQPPGAHHPAHHPQMTPTIAQNLSAHPTTSYQRPSGSDSKQRPTSQLYPCNPQIQRPYSQFIPGPTVPQPPFHPHPLNRGDLAHRPLNQSTDQSFRMLPMPIPNQYPPMSPQLQNLPNTRRVSFHAGLDSVRSHHARPLDSAQLDPGSPPLSPNHTFGHFPGPPVVSPPRASKPPSGAHDVRRRPVAEQPERIVTGVLRGSLPAQQRPNPPTANNTPRPLSMSANELSARHRAALHRLQQPSSKPTTSSNRPSPLSKSFTSPIASPVERPVLSPRPGPRPLQSPDVTRDRSRTSSAYVQALTHVGSGKPLVEKEKLNQAERALLSTLPPLPPQPSGSKKPASAKKSSASKDPYSWFDY